MSHRTRETQGTDALLEPLGGPSPACTLTSAQGDPRPSVTCRRARVWCVQSAAPANRPRPVATPPPPDPGPLGEAGRPRGRASRCWFWEAEPAASGPVRVAHMAPAPGLTGGVRGRGAPHLGPGELPAQLGDTSSGVDSPAPEDRWATRTELVSRTWSLPGIQVAWQRGQHPGISLAGLVHSNGAQGTLRSG